MRLRNCSCWASVSAAIRLRSISLHGPSLAAVASTRPTVRVRLQVERGRQRPLRAEAGGRQGAELARHFGAVHVGVVALDAARRGWSSTSQPWMSTLAPLGSSPSKSCRAVEGAGGAPAHRRLLSLGHHLDDLQLEVGEGSEEVAEPGPVADRAPAARPGRGSRRRRRARRTRSSRRGRACRRFEVGRARPSRCRVASLLTATRSGYPCRSCARLILPLLVFGSSAANSTMRGNL